MPRKTFLDERPEIIRGPRGLAIRLLGQTYEPRSGTVSARVLEDATLDAQLAMAMETSGFTLGGTPLRLELYRQPGTSFILCGIRGGIEIVGRTVLHLIVEIFLDDPKLKIQSVKMTRPGEQAMKQLVYAEEGPNPIDPGAVDRLVGVLGALLDYLVAAVPEIRARGRVRESSLHAARAARLIAVRTGQVRACDIAAGSVMLLDEGKQRFVVENVLVQAKSQRLVFEGHVDGKHLAPLRRAPLDVIDIAYLD